MWESDSVGTYVYVVSLLLSVFVSIIMHHLFFCVVVATIGFIGAPYYVNETAGTATLTIGVINGSVDVSISLNVQLQGGSAVGMSIVILDF